MALSALQLADLVAKAKLFMRIGDDDSGYQADAIAIYHDESAAATAVTATVTRVALVLVITGGGNAGTDTLTLSAAANDTLTELVAVINALAKGFVATLVEKGTADSALLNRKLTTSIFGDDNEITLTMENEELLELLITNLWDALESELGRDLLSTAYTELFPFPGGARSIILSHPYVTQITQVALDYENGLRVSYSGADTHARVEVTSTGVICTSRAAGTTTTDTILFADQADTSLMAAAVTALVGWTGTVVNTRPSAYLVQRRVQDYSGGEVTLDVWDDYSGDYEIDYAAGTIDFNWPMYATSNGWANIAYTAGLSAIPSDIEHVILSLVKAAWDAAGRDATMLKEKLGDYAYELNPYDKRGPGFASYEAVLSKYRRVRV